MAEFQYPHIGQKIAEMLADNNMSKTELGEVIGMSQSNAIYLTKRASIDVVNLHKISVALNYNFFKLYPVDEGTSEPADAAWKAKIAELEKHVEQLKLQNDILQKENGYVKKINELLEKR
jgi:DNA-binding Xre family transcriptional regulator